MPRFFFHIYDDVVLRDEDGLELPSLAAARREALAGIREMMCDQVRNGRLSLHHRVEVENEAGEPVLAISFGEAIRRTLAAEWECRLTSAADPR